VRTRNDKISRVMRPLLSGAAMLLAGAGVASLEAARVGIGPRVGDMITFDMSDEARVEPGVRLLVDRPNQFACVLDLDTIAHHGGSLVLEARLFAESHAFFLHWAGEKTSSDAGDCGKDADLIVDRRDMDVLASASGGYGVGPRRTPVVIRSIPF